MATNWCKNPSLEVDTTNWQTGNCSLATSTVEQWVGARSGLVTITNAASAPFIFTPSTLAAGIVVAPGDVVRGRVRILGPAGRSVRFQPRFVNSANVQTNFLIGPDILLTGNWQTISVPDHTALTDNVRYALLLRFDRAAVPSLHWVNGDVAYVDAVDVRINEPYDSYFDGARGAGYAWTGAAHASASTRAELAGSAAGDGVVVADALINVDELSEVPSYYGGAAYGTAAYGGVPILGIGGATPGRGGGITTEVRLYRATVDNDFVEDLSEHGVEGSVTMNLDREIKLNATFTIPDPGRVTPYKDYLAPVLTVEYDDGSPSFTRQLGLYAVRIPPAAVWPDDSVATFSGEGLETLLAASAYADPDEVPSGVSFRDEFIATVGEAGITRVSVPQTSRVTGYHRTYPPGITRLDKLKALAERMLMYPPYGDLEGRVTTQRVGSKRTQEPYLTVLDEDLLTEISVQPADLQVYNVYVVVRSNPAEPPLRGVARNDDAASPTSTVSLGVERTRVEFVGELEDQVDADERARAGLERARSYYRTARVAVLPNRSFGFHQTLELALTGHWSRLNGLWLVRNWTMGFGPDGAALTHEVSQLTSALTGSAV